MNNKHFIPILVILILVSLISIIWFDYQRKNYIYNASCIPHWEKALSLNKSISSKEDALETFKELYIVGHEFYSIENITNLEIEFENQNLSVWLLVTAGTAIDYEGNFYAYRGVCI